MKLESYSAVYEYQPEDLYKVTGVRELVGRNKEVFAPFLT
jgi:hypothetical protein